MARPLYKTRRTMAVFRSFVGAVAYLPRLGDAFAGSEHRGRDADAELFDVALVVKSEDACLPFQLAG